MSDVAQKMRFGLRRRAIDLLEPFRAVNSAQVLLEDDVWRATGADPSITYKLDRRANSGALVIDLDLDMIEGLATPRIYLHGRKGFTESRSVELRHTGMNHFRLYLFLARPCKLLRLDPSESVCRFRIRQFSVKRVPLAVFASRTMRNGMNRGEETPRVSRLIEAFRRSMRTGIAAETVDGTGYFDSEDGRYRVWRERFDYSEAHRVPIAAAVDELAAKPLISVLMPVYNTKAALLDAAIGSVVDQIYPNWELCIADDASTAPWVRPTLEAWRARDSRIKVVFRPANGHIAEATNSAFTLASGEYVALLDHDDILRPHALAEVAFALARQPDAELIYSDEDKIEEDGHRRFDPFFKPDWNPELFLGQNYLNHLTVHRAANIRAVGGWRKEFYGSQDYDLNLRIVQRIEAGKILHIPKILYHWRLTPESMAQDEDSKGYAVDNAVKALQSFLDTNAIAGTVERIGSTSWYRVNYATPEPPPLVSLLIPTRNGVEILKACIESIRSLTSYPNYEIIVIDNGSDDPATLKYFSHLEATGQARTISYPHPFNYSAINNFGVSQARGEFIGLVNNDITVISPGWLTEMVSLAMRPGVGCVGAKLYYPNDTIQHAGVIIGLGGVAGHSHKYFDRDSKGYFGRLKVVHNVTAVTAACLVVRKSIYEEVGGLDAENLAVAFNDVDFCLKVVTAGYRNVVTPFAELYHHESLTRGSDDDPAKRQRFQSEVGYMKVKWGHLLGNDPHYSQNLTRKYENFSINLD